MTHPLTEMVLTLDDPRADARVAEMGVTDESWFSYIAPTRSG